METCKKCSGRGEYSTLDSCGCCMTDHICDCGAGETLGQEKKQDKDKDKRIATLIQDKAELVAGLMEINRSIAFEFSFPEIYALITKHTPKEPS